MRRFKRDLAVIVMRGQDFHLGHCSLFDIALQYADRVMVFLGSAQEHGTVRNPFSILTRANMIKTVYPQDNVIIKPLNDLSHEGDVTADWGRYVKENILSAAGKLPELMIYGNDEERGRWFDKADIEWIDIMVPRNTLPISGTMMRELMISGSLKDRSEWYKYHDESLHKEFWNLRNELLAIPYYKEQCDAKF